MKNKVFKILTKGGFTEEMANRMIEENFDVAVKSYPEAKPSFIADVVSSL